MDQHARKIIVGATIIGGAIVMGAYLIAYALSFEGKWNSCVATLDQHMARLGGGANTTPEKLCFTLFREGGGI
jgi:hypothetical protein